MRLNYHSLLVTAMATGAVAFGSTAMAAGYANSGNQANRLNNTQQAQRVERAGVTPSVHATDPGHANSVNPSNAKRQSNTEVGQTEENLRRNHAGVISTYQSNSNSFETTKHNHTEFSSTQPKNNNHKAG